MKDNQMKQAEESIITDIDNWLSDIEKDARAVGFVSSAKQFYERRYKRVSDLRAKLTTSQVSEPYAWANKIGFILRNGVKQAMILRGDRAALNYDRPLYLHPPTTPQEAISPAIAEYIERLEGALRLSKNIVNGEQDNHAIFGNEQDIAKYLQKHKALEQEAVKHIDEVLASKPTGLE